MIVVVAKNLPSIISKTCCCYRLKGSTCISFQKKEIPAELSELYSIAVMILLLLDTQQVAELDLPPWNRSKSIEEKHQ